MYQPKATKVDKKFIPIAQSGFSKGYISTLTDSRIPLDGLIRMTNMWLEQDSIARPRPPFIAWGKPYLGTCLGNGKYTQIVLGLPVYWEISMQTVGGTTAIYIRKDGGTWTIVAGGNNTYNASWANFCQGAAVNSSGTISNRVYITNGFNNMSYYDIDNAVIVFYTTITTPTGLAVINNGSTGLAGTTYNEYYMVTANNAGGETAACAQVSFATTTNRVNWVTNQSLILSWAAVSGATSYNIYTAEVSGQCAYLATVSGLSFIDYGAGSQANAIPVNPYKLAPTYNSTGGPIITYLTNMDNQLYGCGDVNHPSYLWYSGQGQHFGDWSFNPQGGGYVAIDYGGDTIPTVPFSFQDGKGNPVLSVLTYGQAGRGKLFHMTLTTTTVGSTPITYPNVYEASSKDGTPAQRGVALYNNAAYYCTGLTFKTTGIKPNVINILSTQTISDQLYPDLQDISLGALTGAVAQEYLGKIYFAMPVGGSTTNNKMWILDMTRNGLWILDWPVNVQHMWLYEDNFGNSHLVTLQNNIALELDLNRTSTPTQDNGVVFSTDLASGAMTFDKGGVAMFSSYYTYFKFLYPQGTLNINVYGNTESNNTALLLANDTINYQAIVSRVGYGQMTWSNPAALLPTTYSGQVGPVTVTTVNMDVQPLEIDEIVNQQSWEITTNTVGCDYLLSSVTTTGYTIPKLYAGNT